MTVEAIRGAIIARDLDGLRIALNSNTDLINRTVQGTVGQQPVSVDWLLFTVMVSENCKTDEELRTLPGIMNELLERDSGLLFNQCRQRGVGIFSALS